MQMPQNRDEIYMVYKRQIKKLYVAFWRKSGLDGVRTLTTLIYAESGIFFIKQIWVCEATAMYYPIIEFGDLNAQWLLLDNRGLIPYNITEIQRR